MSIGRFLQKQRGKLKNTEISVVASVLKVHLILIQSMNEQTKQGLSGAMLSLCLIDTGTTVGRLWYKSGVRSSKNMLINCGAFRKEPPEPS